MVRIDQKTSIAFPSGFRRDASRVLPLLPFLASVACADKVAQLLDNDNGENFNIELVAAEVTVKEVPYTDLEAVTDESVDEDSFDGHGVGIFLDNGIKDDWEFDRTEGKIWVTTPFWCNTALAALNVYNHFELGKDNCIQDSTHCDSIDCSEEALTETALRLYEEDQEEGQGEDEEVEEVPSE